MRRFVLQGLAGGLVTTTLAFGPTPAVAVATPTMNGAGVWGGTVSLVRYPCVGGCSFSFTGTFGGEMDVFDGNHLPLYQATWPSGSQLTGQLQASGTYTESCGFLPFVSPLNGSASGSFTVSGGTLMQNGTVLGTAILTGGFAWTRIGGIVLVSSTTPLSLENGGGTVLATAQTAAVGFAVMGPPVEPTSAEPLPPNCANEQPIWAVIGGELTQADG